MIKQSKLNNEYTFAVIMAIAQDYQFTRQIRVSQADLMMHVIQRFNPAAVRELGRVYREHPDVIGFNRPTSIWRPSDGWPPRTTTQPTATQSADDDTEPLTVPIFSCGTDGTE
jgi:predicted acyl esterase